MFKNPQDEKKIIMIALTVVIFSLITASIYWAWLFKGLLRQNS